MKKRKPKIVFNTQWFSIEAIPVKDSVKLYYRLNCQDSVGILAKTADGDIVLIRQYRPSIEMFSIELPSGYIDKGETPKRAAERELLEETGFKCKKIFSLGRFKIVPSRINNNVHCFFGSDAVKACYNLPKDKDIEVTLVKQREFDRMILSGRYTEVGGIAIYHLAMAKKYL